LLSKTKCRVGARAGRTQRAWRCSCV